MLYPSPNETELKKVAIAASKNVFGDEERCTKLVLHIEAQFTTGFPGSQKTQGSTIDRKKDQCRTFYRYWR